MEVQKKYWKETDYCIEHLIRLAKKLPSVKEWLIENKDRLSCLIIFLQNYPEVPSKYSKSKRDSPTEPEMKVHKSSKTCIKKNNRFGHHGTPDVPSGYVFTQMSPTQPYGLSNQAKLAYLEAIINGSADQLDDENADDSDVEFENATHTRWFRQKDELDVLDLDFNWLKSEVVVTWGNYIYINYVDFKNEWDEWIDRRSPRVAVKGTFTVEKPNVSSDPDDEEMEGEEQTSKTEIDYPSNIKSS